MHQVDRQRKGYDGEQGKKFAWATDVLFEQKKENGGKQNFKSGRLVHERGVKSTSDGGKPKRAKNDREQRNTSCTEKQRYRNAFLALTQIIPE